MIFTMTPRRLSVRATVKPCSLVTDGFFLVTREVNCAEVADERVPTFKDLLQRWFDEAAWHAPSILFFDDIDRLVPAEVEHADSSRSRHLAELFLRTATVMTRRHSIMLIATSQQQQSLHPSLISNHIFTELRHINPPSRDERKEVRRIRRSVSLSGCTKKDYRSWRPS